MGKTKIFKKKANLTAGKLLRYICIQILINSIKIRKESERLRKWKFFRLYEIAGLIITNTAW